MIYFLKRHWLIFSILCLIIVAIAAAYLADFSRPMNWGVTFSADYAQNELGLDWKEAYIAILDDLKVDRIRLSAYWNKVETEKGIYDFSVLDYQINEASKRNTKIILAVGRRLPRWPECHDPIWIKHENSIDVDLALVKYVETVVKRYESNNNIIYWQVENEPYLGTFGVCPQADTNLLKEEINMVKSLSKKPILVTDSGELSTWWPISHSGGDILGTTLYRVVYNPYFGYFRWFTPPFFYWSRIQLLQIISPIKRVIAAEVQGESWHKAGQNLSTLTIAEHNESMSVGQFKQNIIFTRKAGFDEAYLWGVEWWYLMKKDKNYPAYWNEAKRLWTK